MRITVGRHHGMVRSDLERFESECCGRSRFAHVKTPLLTARKQASRLPGVRLAMTQGVLGWHTALFTSWQRSNRRMVPELNRISS